VVGLQTRYSQEGKGSEQSRTSFSEDEGGKNTGTLRASVG